MKESKYTFAACAMCGTPNTVINPKWLRAQREGAELTLREMARRLDFSAPYICDVELGRRRCSPKILAAYDAL